MAACCFARAADATLTTRSVPAGTVGRLKALAGRNGRSMKQATFDRGILGAFPGVADRPGALV